MNRIEDLYVAVMGVALFCFCGSKIEGQNAKTLRFRYRSGFSFLNESNAHGYQMGLRPQT